MATKQENDVINLVGVLSSLKVLKNIEGMKNDFSEIVGKNLKDIVKENAEHFKGPPGPRGVDGAFGPRGVQGPKGPDGPRGVSLKDVEIVSNGTDELNFVFHFSDGSAKQFAKNIQGPRGEKGTRGQRGKEGPRGLEGPQGLAGNPGAGFNWAGIYQNSKTYKKNDVVSFKNALYIALKNDPRSNPGVSKDWEKIISVEHFWPLPRTSSAGLSLGGITKWLSAQDYPAEKIVYYPGDLKLYLSTGAHRSAIDFYDDYRAGLWACLSDSSYTQPLLNAATGVLILKTLKPHQVTTYFVDILCQRMADNVAYFYKLTITLVWDGFKWIKSEANKSHFPGSIIDDIKFFINTLPDSSGVLSYNTPNLLGVYDPVFSRLVASTRVIL